MGIFFEDDGHWTLISGKKAGEWRGTAVAFSSLFSHNNATIHPRGSSVVLSRGNQKMGVICAHIPHHATMEETSTILADMLHSVAMKQPKLILGLDANEVFSHSDSAPAFPKGHTGRGETILEWCADNLLKFPKQQLHLPSHFPYSGQQPGRLDYLAMRGVYLQGGHVGEHRDRAHSDHEPIIGILPDKLQCKQFHKLWGPRHLHKNFQEVLDRPHMQGDIHHRIATICKDMTNPGRAMDKFTESRELKEKRRGAQATPPGPGRRLAWKEVQAMHKLELKQWHVKLNEAASKRDSRAHRAQKPLARTREWERYLLDDANWQTTLKQHFEDIFHKEDPASVASRMQHMRDELTYLCKTHAWHPFQLAELKVTQGRWPRRKAAGPDGITHEALSVLMLDDKWAHRILYILNDAFYRGTLPELLEKGVTVLLPKTAAPDGWPETRPITISSAKWIAQLVLHRTQHLFDPICKLQWRAKGRQSVEMLLAIRKFARMARDWGRPFYIIKIDVKKAFDSATQTSMGRLVTEHIGKQGHPWEAHVWISLLHATEMNIQFGGTSVKISQSDGVRQGGPDSPVAFSALVGDTLLKTQSRVTISAWGPDSKLPPPPHHTSGHMDDVYVWGENPKHVQQVVDILEKFFAEHGSRLQAHSRALSQSSPAATLPATLPAISPPAPAFPHCTLHLQQLHSPLRHKSQAPA